MQKTKIFFNHKCETAKDQRDFMSLDNSSYYESPFANSLKGLTSFVDCNHDGITHIDTEHSEKEVNTVIYHQICYTFERPGMFQKQKVQKYIFDEWAKKLPK